MQCACSLNGKAPEFLGVAGLSPVMHNMQMFLLSFLFFYFSIFLLKEKVISAKQPSGKIEKVQKPSVCNVRVA